MKWKPPGGAAWRMLLTWKWRPRSPLLFRPSTTPPANASPRRFSAFAANSSVNSSTRRCGAHAAAAFSFSARAAFIAANGRRRVLQFARLAHREAVAQPRIEIGLGDARARLRIRPIYAARSVTEIAPRASSRLTYARPSAPFVSRQRELGCMRALFASDS